VRRLAARLAEKVHAEGGLTRGAARRTMASKDRGLFDAAAEYASGEAWIELGESGLVPGTSRPG
jgi:hypothetical protein